MRWVEQLIVAGAYEARERAPSASAFVDWYQGQQTLAMVKGSAMLASGTLWAWSRWRE